MKYTVKNMNDDCQPASRSLHAALVLLLYAS